MKPTVLKEDTNKAIEKAKQKEKELGFAALSRREKYIISGVSPSTQRRYEKIGLEDGTLDKDSQGILHLNSEKCNQEMQSIEND